MDVKQIATFVNNVAKQSVGLDNVLAEDLSNVVDAGAKIIDVGLDKFVKALPDHYGKIWFDARKYDNADLGLMVDGWEYGSIAEKIRVAIPEAQENESWKLTNGQSYDPNIFYQPTATATFWNMLDTFEIPMSFAEKQVKTAFDNAGQLNAFISLIETQVDNGMKIRMRGLAHRLLCDRIAETVYSEVGSGVISGRSGVKSVNLLYEYNTIFGTSLTASNCLYNADFLKYATMRISVYKSRIEEASTLFNIESNTKFTSPDYFRCILLDEFAKAIGPYSLAPAYNKEYLALPDAKVVQFWQGSGTSYAFSDISKVYCSSTAGGHAKTVTGVLAVMFDKTSCVMANESRRVTSNYNAKAEFFTNFFKADMRYLVDNGENFVVFYVA